MIVAIAVVYVGDHFLPRSRPEWTRSFVKEERRTTADADLGIAGPEERRLRWTIVLTLVSVLGAAANLTQVTTVGYDGSAVSLLVSWVCDPFPTLIISFHAKLIME